jgi:hypothetical protein
VSFKLRFTPSAAEAFATLQSDAEQAGREHPPGTRGSKSSKQEGLFKQVAKALRLLAENPRHPGLQTHEYESLEHPFDSSQKVFEAYAQNKTPGAYRIFWCYGPARGVLTIVGITSHP